MNDLYLQHHGIMGQKWGVRRYQNPDGSLTSVGRSRYDVGYTKKGSYLKDENGKKISNRERKKLIKEIKKDKEVSGEYKYLEKQYKRAKSSTHVGYVGSDPFAAMMASSSYKSAVNLTKDAEERVNKFLSEYNNKKISELEKTDSK